MREWLEAGCTDICVAPRGCLRMGFPPDQSRGRLRNGSCNYSGSKHHSMKIFLVWLFAVFGVLSHAQVLPQGTRNILTYSSFLGGKFDDFPHAMTVDAQGNVYIVGETNSPDFPVTSGALQRVHAGVPGGSTSF